MSAATLSTLMTQADAAIAAGDWAAVKSLAQRALATLIAMPDGDKMGLRLQWSRESVQALIQMADTELAAAASVESPTSGVMRSQKMNFVPVSC